MSEIFYIRQDGKSIGRIPSGVPHRESIKSSRMFVTNPVDMTNMVKNKTTGRWQYTSPLTNNVKYF